MDTTKLRPSRNTEERLLSGMPLDRAYIAGRITAIYSALADCGIFVERMKNHDDWHWLHGELLEASEAIDIVMGDLAVKGDIL